MKSFKRALSMLLCLMMVLSAVAVSADTLELTVDSNSYITNATFEPVQGGTTGLTKVTIPYTASTSPKYISLLAYTTPTAQETMIGNAVALEQYTHSDADGNAVFYIINPADDSDLEIKMGGSGLTAVDAKLKLKSKDYDVFTINFYAKGDTTTPVKTVANHPKETALADFPTIDESTYDYQGVGTAADTFVNYDAIGWTVDETAVTASTTDWAALDAEDGKDGIVNVEVDYDADTYYETTIVYTGFGTTGDDGGATVTKKTTFGVIPAPGVSLPANGEKTHTGWSLNADAYPVVKYETTQVLKATETGATVTLEPIWEDAPAIAKGDATGEGRITVADAQRVAAYVAKKVGWDGEAYDRNNPVAPTTEQFNAVDVAGDPVTGGADGRLTVADAQRIAAFVAKKVNWDGSPVIK